MVGQGRVRSQLPRAGREPVLAGGPRERNRQDRRGPQALGLLLSGRGRARRASSRRCGWGRFVFRLRCSACFLRAEHSHPTGSSLFKDLSDLSRRSALRRRREKRKKEFLVNWAGL